MAFRKFGGLEYNKTNNYVSANTTNNMKLNISDHIGKLNTKIVVDSHLDLNNQSMFNVGNIYFSNGTDLQSLADNLDLLSSNNIWSGINTFTKSTNFKDITSSSATITSLATIASVVASYIVSEDLSSTTGKFNTISSKQGNLVCNSNIDLSKNDITNIKSLTSYSDSGNTGASGQVITADGSGGWSWEDGTGEVNSITGGDGIVVSPSTGDVIISTTLLETSNTWSSTNTFSSEAIFANGIDMSGKNISKIDTLSGNNAPINCGSLLMDGDIDMDTFTIKNLNAISLGTVTGTTQLSTNTISVGTTASLQSLGIGDTANTGNINYGGVSQSCYSSDLSTATLSESGLYFGRNLGGDNEFNMIALTDGDTGPLLNIYASYQDINGIGVTGATASGSYTHPLVSMYQTQVDITGNIITATNGLGGTSVFNDSVCNFNNISCNSNIGCGSLSSTGAISGSQLTLTSVTGSTLLTTDATGLISNDSITLPAQTTYTPSTSYGNLASTQAFVQSAINSQGAGDVTTGGNNNFTGVNNFNPTPVQDYGAVMNTGITITNNQSTSTASGDSTIVSYTPTSTVGFEIYSLSTTNSCAGVIPQLQLQPDGAQSKLSAPATNGLIVLAATSTGGSIQLNADTGVKIGTQPILTFSTFGNLTGSATGITSSVNLTTPSFIISDGVDDNYQLFSQNSPSYGLVIANASGGLGTLTLSNGSTTLSTLTATTTGLTISKSLIVSGAINGTGLTTTGNISCGENILCNGLLYLSPAAATNPPNISSGVSNNVIISCPNNSGIEINTLALKISLLNNGTGLTISTALTLPEQTTYTPSTTYGNVGATQQFVQLALASQGGGDVTTGGTNDFTGINTFNNNNNGGTITKTGLTIAGNTQIGFAENDIICINNFPASNVGLNIYVEPTMVTFSTDPKIRVYNDGTPTLFNTDITLPAQTTYTPSTTYGDVGATQQFVQLALASQGSGDVTLAGNNAFTGTNTFNVNPPTSTINQISTNTTQFATIGYVNGIVSEPYPANALLPGEYTGGGGAGYTYTSNVTGSITGNYIGVNTIQVYPTTITCFASTVEGGDASETITFNLARALAPNSLTSNTLSGLSATITSAYNGSMRGCQLIAGFYVVSQVYTLSVFVNSNNYFSGPGNYTISFSGLINYVPVT